MHARHSWSVNIFSFLFIKRALEIVIDKNYNSLGIGAIATSTGAAQINAGLNLPN